jgi:Flp pilus assembly protein CpaB
VEFAEKVLASRRGTVLFGVGAAVLAGILLLVYINRYRANVESAQELVPVLVAKHLIQKGAPGSVIGTQGGYQSITVPKDRLRDGAFTDSSTLSGLVAAHDIYKGQQLTAADFVPTTPDALQNKLSGIARAIAIPIDTAHGMIGQIAPGDHVDVYVGLEALTPAGSQPVIKQIITNALVLRTPGTGATGGSVVLRGKGPEAAELAWAADNGKLWLVLRPASGVRPVRPGLITGNRLLGLRPVG